MPRITPQTPGYISPEMQRAHIEQMAARIGAGLRPPQSRRAREDREREALVLEREQRAPRDGR